MALGFLERRRVTKAAVTVRGGRFIVHGLAPVTMWNKLD